MSPAGVDEYPLAGPELLELWVAASAAVPTVLAAPATPPEVVSTAADEFGSSLWPHPTAASETPVTATMTAAKGILKRSVAVDDLVAMRMTG